MLGKLAGGSQCSIAINAVLYLFTRYAATVHDDSYMLALESPLIFESTKIELAAVVACTVFVERECGKQISPSIQK